MVNILKKACGGQNLGMMCWTLADKREGTRPTPDHGEGPGCGAARAPMARWPCETRYPRCARVAASWCRVAARPHHTAPTHTPSYTACVDVGGGWSLADGGCGRRVQLTGPTGRFHQRTDRPNQYRRYNGWFKCMVNLNLWRHAISCFVLPWIEDTRCSVVVFVLKVEWKGSNALMRCAAGLLQAHRQPPQPQPERPHQSGRKTDSRRARLQCGVASPLSTWKLPLSAWFPARS